MTAWGRLVVNIPEQILKILWLSKKYSSNLIFISSMYNEKVNMDGPMRLCRSRMLQVVLYASNNAKVFDGRNLNHSSIP